MDFNPRSVPITTTQQAYNELRQIDCDPTGIGLMVPKAVFKAVKLENVPAKEANLLKQTFLAKGGEVAVARGTANLSCEFTDVLICATIKQYRLALAQLKIQPWGLPRLAEAVEACLTALEHPADRKFQWPNQALSIKKGKTLIMGILNVTPDSFSDGGNFNSVDRALYHMEAMIRHGADIIDIGAESTRPYKGSEKISFQEEMERLLPILEKVLQHSSVPVSVDTYKASVAKEALKLGSHIINDVWGLQFDPEMAAVVAKYNVPVVVMHNQAGTVYQRDILSEICRFLRKSIEIGIQAGIDAEKFILDPGIGFGKTPQQNLTVMSRLEELQALGHPVLLGTSRKRFIGEVLNVPVEERVEGTAATVTMGIMKGVNIVRVHDVQQIAQIAKMTDAMIKEIE